MIEGLERVTTSALALALDAASLRQQVTAMNIANANTAGYTAMRVNFEEQLEDARRSLSLTGSADATSLMSVRPAMAAVSPDAAGQSPQVQLDVESAEMARNAVHYQALLKGLSRHLSIMSMAASDGRK